MSLSTALPARRTLTAVALAVAAAGGVAVAGSAHADGCTSIGNGLTAAVVAHDATPVAGDVTAAGCYYGVYVGPGVSASVTDATIHGYVKAGVFVDGTTDAPASVTVTGSHVTGTGDGAAAAQNGVEFWGANASGLVRGNTIDGNYYSGADWTATGLLMFDVNPKQINASQNKFVDDQTNQAMVNDSSCANQLGHFYGNADLCS